MAAHDCFYIRTNKSSLSIPKVFDQSQETVNLKLVAETSANENIAVSLTSKISSPSRKINEDDSPQSLSPTTFKHLPSPSIKTLKGDFSGKLTSSAVSHKFQSSRRSSPATKTRRSENEASKRVSTKYPVYATPPRSIRPSKELKNDSLNFKNSATKNLFERHRRSSIATTERSPEIEVPSKIYTKYPVYVTPPRSICPSKELKNDSLNFKNSATKNPFERQRRSSIATTERSPEIEVSSKIYTKDPAYVTPPRSIPSSHIHNDDSSRRLINPVAINLFQSPQIYSTEMISAFPGNVVIPAPINLNLSPRIYSTGTFTHSSRGIVIPPAINLEESPRIYNTETITHSPGRVIIPAPVNILQSPEMYIIHRPSYSSGSVMSSTAVILQPCPIYITETVTDSSGSAVIPAVVNPVQPPQLYSTKTLNDSSGSTINPTPVNLFQEPRIHDSTTKTVSTQTEFEEYDSPKSLSIASPNPVSSPSKKNKSNIKSGILSTMSDISPKEKVDHTERESSVNDPTFVKPKTSSPSSDGFSTLFKFAGAARKSFPSSTCSKKETTIRKIVKKRYLSFDKPIRKSSSLKTFPKDSIDSKKLEKVNLSQSSLSTSISAGNLTPETESGKSKPLSSETPKRLSPSFTARIKDSSGGFVNQETEGASESPQSSNISDEKISPQTESAKESYAKSLPFSSPKKSSPNRSEGNTPEKIKKQKYRSLLD
ncbi:hypothetical protein TNCT_476831 [Trichonephila clavata]|uniref:Uncharacterized protein n=1 Tax=Trichonephila clavata TaxID=2740835 RepID=A0A8X6I9K1_TRICU|nr:hypothetical protein TNCT_476831 [Trichonephila clavata]